MSMSEDLRALLEAKARDANPVIAAHARRRLGDLVDTPRAARPPALRPMPGPGSLAKINACIHRDCNTGCRLTICRANRGDREGGHRATLWHCLACLDGSAPGPAPGP